MISDFFPTNAPKDPNGGRGAEFSHRWTCIGSVAAVFVDALPKAQGVHGQLNSGLCHLLGAMGVLVGKKSRKTLPKFPKAGIALPTVGRQHRVRVRGEVHGRALRRAHGHWCLGLEADT